MATKGQLPIVKRILLLLLVISVSAFAVESQKVDPELYADPIPVKITNPIFDAMGLKPDQRHLFRVCRKVPLELGGTNSTENLIVLSRKDAAFKRSFDLLILEKIRRNKMTIDAAVKQLQDWKPGVP